MGITQAVPALGQPYPGMTAEDYGAVLNTPETRIVRPLPEPVNGMTHLAVVHIPAERSVEGDSDTFYYVALDDATKAYNPNQPRGAGGRWTSGGSAGGAATLGGHGQALSPRIRESRPVSPQDMTEGTPEEARQHYVEPAIKDAEGIGFRFQGQTIGSLTNTVTRIKDNHQMYATAESVLHQRAQWDMADNHGVPEGHSERFMADWTMSKTTVPEAGVSTAALQQAVAEHFGVPLAPAQWLVDKFKDHPDYPSRLEEARRFVPAQYAYTQDYYKRHGITNVTLYRGVYMPDDGSVHIPKGLWDVKVVTGPSGRTTNIESQGRVVGWDHAVVEQHPLKAWTNSPELAGQYAQNEHGVFGNFNDGFGMVLATQVPVERVFSNGVTGVGISSAGEHLVLGGDLNVGAAGWSQYG